jgi:glycosyltransferase involved in cell wall biosynthesis
MEHHHPQSADRILDLVGNDRRKRIAMSLDTPPIAPLADSESRPTWSVMIPAYNCTRYLRQTLQSVLSQAPGLEKMHIEVVDDHSTIDDPESLVKSVGGGRVAFYRNPQNLGAVANFNNCIRRSRGRWVHILHGDDLVEPGFYRAMEACMNQHPNAALLAARSHHMDDGGVVRVTSPRVPVLESFTTQPRPLFLGNHLRTPGVVVCRSFYEQHGGFLESLVHTADWEMWCRAIARQGGVMLPLPLARYRESAGNDTSRLMRTADNLRDTARLGSVLSRLYADFDSPAFLQMLRLNAWNQLQDFEDRGDVEAIQAHLEFCALLRVTDLSGRLRMKQYLKSIPLVRHLAAALRNRRSASHASPPHFVANGVEQSGQLQEHPL